MSQSHSIQVYENMSSTCNQLIQCNAIKASENLLDIKTNLGSFVIKDTFIYQFYFIFHIFHYKVSKLNDVLTNDNDRHAHCLGLSKVTNLFSR